MSYAAPDVGNMLNDPVALRAVLFTLLKLRCDGAAELPAEELLALHNGPLNSGTLMYEFTDNSLKLWAAPPKETAN